MAQLPSIAPRRSRMERYVEVSLHVLIWAYVITAPLLFKRKSEEIDWLSYARHLYFPVVSCVLFYVNFLGLVPRLFLRRRITRFVVINLLLVATASLGASAYDRAFPSPRELARQEWAKKAGQDQQAERAKKAEQASKAKKGDRRRPVRPRPPFMPFAGHAALPFAFMVFLATVVHLSLQWRKAENARREAELGRSEAELKNLKNQINPHFLLNTLNNIYALTAIDTGRAQAAIEELSRLLRYVLYENQAELVDLDREVEFIETYVALMRIRLPQSVEVKMQVELPRGVRVKVAPLIFISLVENAFKHGISPTQPSYISISLSADEKSITFACLNSNYPKGSSDMSPGGIGLQQVARRLEAAYPKAYEWQHGPTADGLSYTSTIVIQLPANHVTPLA